MIFPAEPVARLLSGKKPRPLCDGPRLFNEARAVNIVQHTGIVGIFEVGQLPGGDLYLVMEYLEGRPLRSSWPIAKDPLTRVSELGLLRQVASALQAAHDKGIVHRDLKPENVMVIPDSESMGGERIKVLDFGLAKLAVSAVPNLRTRSDALLGTPGYMSPEQCRAAADVDAKTDVYALGVMLFEALTARLPFDAAGPGELLAMHLYREPPRPQSYEASIPPALDSLIRNMLAKDATARPSMGAVAEQLSAVIKQLRSQTAPVSPRARIFSSRGTRGAAVALVLTGLGAALYLGRHAGHHVRPESVHPPVPLALVSETAQTTSRLAPPKMIYLAGGAYLMGSTEEEVDAAYEFCRRLLGDLCQRDFYQRELPQRALTLSPFYMDATEVTNEDFAAWLNQLTGVHVTSGRLVDQDTLLLADLYPAYGYSGLRYQQSAPPAAGVIPTTLAGGKFLARPGLEQKPVVQVSWHAAQRYCRAHGGRLPSEAEWELAARGRHGYRFPWGDDEPGCDGVVFGRLRGEACANSGVGPMAVGRATQDATPAGVRDLGGNVSEWVMDVLRVPYPDCSPSCRDPVSLPSAATATEAAAAELTAPRVVRGGNWFQAAESCRGAGRSRLPGNQVKGNIGFRCVRPVNLE